MEDLSAYIEDVETALPTQNELEAVSRLIKHQVALEDWLASAEALVKKRKAELADVSEIQIPKALADAGISKFATDDGFEVAVKENVYASITKKNEDEAFDWLRQNGHDSIIKRAVTLDYGSGQDAEADAMVQYLIENTEGASLKQKIAVHSSTLKSFVRNCIDEGINIPEDVFGVFIRNETKVKRP